MFTSLPSASVIVALLMFNFPVVPSSYVKFISPPVKSMLSPCLYVDLLGFVIVIPDTVFINVTSKSVVNSCPFV